MRLAVLALGLLACSTVPPDDAGARAVEGRLIAPCCWTQTLDVHESEPAAVLRAEIHGRLARGESGAAIEDDLAARYGERIRAVNKGGDARNVVPAVAGLAMLASAAALITWVRSRKRVRPALKPVAADGYDARLDAELEHFT